MATMAENVIAAGSENCPPMLKKGMYDSWKTRIILYIQGNENGEMLIDSIKNGPVKLLLCYNLLLKITIKDTDGVTGIRRPQKVTDLSQEEKLRYDENTYNPPLSYNSQQIQYHTQPSEFYQPYQHYQSNTQITQKLIQSPPLQSYAPTVVQQPPTFQLDTRFVIPNFLPTDDPIASLNTAMIFLSSAYGSRYPPTNNQLRTSFNPRTQATIQNGQVTIQNVQGRQSQGYAGNTRKNQALGARVVNRVGNAGTNQPREELDKLIDERALKYGELWLKESEVQAIKEIKKRLKESELQQQESLVIEESDNNSSETPFRRSEDENRSSDKESSCSEGNNVDVDIGPSNDSDIVTEVPHSNNDAFENVFAHGIQSHELPESIPDTHEVNEYNSNIISDIPNMDPDRDKEEHDDVDYEQQHAFFASLINNLKCDDEKYNEVNREAQQMNIKLLNDEISNLKSQACEKDKTLSKENEKYYEYVQPLLKRKNELENKNQEFLKQINDLDIFKRKIKDENRSSDKESNSSEGNNVDADIGPSNDNDTVTEVPHSNNDTFENVFAHGIQSYELPESIPDTYEVNKNNSNIIFDILNMDPDRDKEEHDDEYYEQQHAFFASLINNLKCDVEKYNEVNREAQQVNVLLRNELERYKEKEKHFAKDKTNESEYCKKIKLLNDEISNLKSQACQKDKTFAKENKKDTVTEIKLLNDEISNLKSQACEKDKIFAKENEKYDDSSEGNNVDADIGPSNDSDTVTEDENRSSDKESSSSEGNNVDADIGPSNDRDTVTENNSNIISDILNMDPDRDKDEHDDVDYEQQCAFSAFLINNLKCDVEKYNEVNREAQHVNVLLRNELEIYKEKEKHFSKDKTIESEYCKKIKLLNDEISNLKSQACEKDKIFAKENEKYDEYVQPFLKRKNELEKKNQEFLKQINDLEFFSEGNNVDADIGPSNDSDTVTENNSNIISDILNMDLDRDKEERDDVDYEQQCAFSASLINNLKCDVEKYNEVNREAQQIKLLNDEISNLKSQACDKDKTFAKENEKYDEYVQPLLKRKNELEKQNQEFLKQINDLEFLKRKNKDENKSSDKESSSSEGNNANADIGPLNDKYIPDTYEVNENNSNIISDIPNMDPDRDKEEHYDVDYEQQRAYFYNRLRKAGQTDQTLRMLLPKEDNVNTGKQGLCFKNQNDDVNPSLLNKARELAPCLYNIDEMGKDLLLNHKIISEEELKCEAEKRLKVKQRKSPLSYHGFVYAETQFEEQPKVLLKRRNIFMKKHLEQTQNLKEHLEQAQLRDHDPKLWNNLPMKYFCYVKQAMIMFEKQTFSKLNLIKMNLKNVNLQLNCFEKSLVKEMKDDLKYVMSLEDEFDEKCLILDIQSEFFKTQFESAISELHIHVYENEMFERISSFENENCCLKKTITQLQNDFSKLEAQSIAFEIALH
ncbi:hypothetical protein Tco_1066358 [Tanacetum coccineum]|uniref:Uncharacterized protein n=1 Tax=Tanacetum coccineum TaxID=301880 RepID=A0ABQ5HB63_9ASTR